MPARKPRTYNPEQTKADICQAGLKLFETVGYHGAAIADICKAAGITKGAFYHHFSSKEELLEQFHDVYWASYSAAVKQGLTASNEPTQQLRSLIFVMVDNVMRYRPYVTVWFQERRHISKERLRKLRRPRDEMLHAMAGVIERGIATGDFRRDVDPIAASLGIIGMCAWTYQWFESGGRLSVEQLADEFAKMTIRGIQK